MQRRDYSLPYIVRWRFAYCILLSMQRIRKTYKLIFVAGILIALIPYAGFPHAWDTVFLTIAGGTVALCSLVLRRATDSIFSGSLTPYASGEIRGTDTPQGPSTK